jgi:hypothetical protein
MIYINQFRSKYNIDNLGSLIGLRVAIGIHVRMKASSPLGDIGEENVEKDRTTFL